MTSTLISRRSLAERWDRSSRSLFRLEQSPPPRYPQPININGRWFYRVAEVEAYERGLAGRREAA